MADGEVMVGAAWPAAFGAEPDNILVLDVKETHDPNVKESFNGGGEYYGARQLRKKVTLVVEVEVLEGGAAGLAALNDTGDGSETDARKKVDFADNNENQSHATVTGWFYVNTQESFNPA